MAPSASVAKSKSLTKDQRQRILTTLAQRKRYLYDPLKDGVTVSLLQKWLTCRRAADIYLQGWVPVAINDSLTFGTMFHGLLQYLYDEWRTSNTNLAAFLEASDRLTSRWLDQMFKRLLNEPGMAGSAQQLEANVAVCEVMAPLYLKRWRSDFTTRKWLALESEFDVKFHNFRLRGKRDGVYTGKDGKLRILETKTRSRMDKEEDTLDALSLDLQSMFYMVATEIETGRRPTGVTYNIIRRPTIYYRKNESPASYSGRVLEDVKKRPSFYFIRYEVNFHPSDLKDFKEDLRNILEEFQGWSRGIGGVRTYRNQASCVGRYMCFYLSCCASGTYDGYFLSKIFRELG